MLKLILTIIVVTVSPLTAHAFLTDIVNLRSIPPSQKFFVLDDYRLTNNTLKFGTTDQFIDLDPDLFTYFQYDGTVKNEITKSDFLSPLPELNQPNPYQITTDGQFFTFENEKGIKFTEFGFGSIDSWKASKDVIVWTRFSSDIDLYYAKVPITTPEPMTLATFGLGLAGFFRRRPS